MKCKECGADDTSVKLYRFGFTVHLGEEKVLSAKIDKHLCEKCLFGNVYSMKGELEFLEQEDNELEDNLYLYINEDLVKDPSVKNK